MDTDKPAALRAQIELEFRSLGFFVEGGKPENPEKNPRSKARTNNKLNPHETASTGIELGSQRWDWGERLPLRHQCSPMTTNTQLLPFVVVFSLKLLITNTKWTSK